MARLPVETAIEELERLTGDGMRVLSLYLLTDPSSGPGGNLHAQLSDLARGLTSRFDPDWPEAKQLQRALDAAGRVVERLGAPPRSLAVFVDAEGRLLGEVRLPVRITPFAGWGDAPALRPLLAALDEHERTLVVLLDKERARLFRVFLQEIAEIADIDDVVPAQHRQSGGTFAYPPTPDWTRGGWPDSGIQRHEEAHVLWHVKRVTEVAARLAGQERVDRVIVGGTPEVLAQFRRLAPKALRGRIAASDLHVPLFARPAEVLAAVREVEEQLERAAEQQLVDDLLERVGSGRVAAGRDEVVAAVNERRVYLLVFTSGTRFPGRHCEQCGALTRTPAPRHCRACGGVTYRVTDLVEHLAARVHAQGGRVEEVRGAAAEQLAGFGGIGALLRYPLAPAPVTIGSEVT